MPDPESPNLTLAYDHLSPDAERGDPATRAPKPEPGNGWKTAARQRRSALPLSERVLLILRGWGMSGRPESALRTSTGCDPAELRAVLTALLDEGRIVRKRMAGTTEPMYFITGR